MNRVQITGCLGLLLAAALPGLAPAQQHMHAGHDSAAGALPLEEAGQGAFAAMQEVVARLSADPSTDWSRVDLDVLREHLVDMDTVLLRARVSREDLPTGARYTVTGEGEVAAAIQRMLSGHAGVMNGIDGWSFKASPRDEGAVLTITSTTPGEVQRIRALGVFGALALGNHHQSHHWMMATGGTPHGHAAE